MTFEQAKEILKTQPKTTDEMRRFQEALKIVASNAIPIPKGN